MLGALDGHLVLPLAGGALHPEHQFLGGLGLLPQNRLGLTTETLLLPVVPWVKEFEQCSKNSACTFAREKTTKKLIGEATIASEY